MTQNIENSIIKVIAQQKHLDPVDISLDSSLEELGISSLDAITIVYDIEELFDIEVPNEKLESLRSVKDIVDGISSLLPTKV